MRATYDPETRELVIYCRPDVKATGTLDYSQGVSHPVPLVIETGSIGDDRGYAASHTWGDIKLDVI